jgi:tetratricopeptide (TPR) repeat protein
MDGLRTYCWAFVLLCGGLGCVHQIEETRTLGPSPANEVAKQEELPKRQPKASTCVALATFREQMAADPKCGGTERERLHDEARKAYTQALRIDPNCLAAHLGLAKLYVTIGDNARAVETFQKALEVHPKEPQLWFEFGMYYARQQQWELAVKNLETASELEPENRQYVNTIGFCLARAGHYDESLAYFQKAVGEGMAHYNVARMLHHLKQDELCRQHLRLALQASPDLDPAWQLLAELETPGTPPVQR